MKQQVTIRRIEQRINDLPLVDAAVSEIMALLNHIDSDFQKIKARLSPEIAAKFLNMANSAYYGLDVRTIDFAVRILGYSGIKQILTTSLIIERFSTGSDGASFDFPRFQEEAHLCAAVAQALGKLVEYEDPAELFTVAMLHNIGEMVIAVCFHEEENGISRTRALEGGYAASLKEGRIFGITHADIGALVLAKFNLSEDICDAVRSHHTTGEMSPEDANFRMKFISREAAGLLDTFVLPTQPEAPSVLPSVRSVLEDSVADNLQAFRKKRKGEERSVNYPVAFKGLLNDASALLYEGLRQHLPLRVASRQESRA